MACADHNPSRRALLGAAVGLPLLRAAGAGITPPPGFTRSPSPSELGEEWEKALAGFEAARAAVLEVEAATAGYGLDAEAALLPAHDSACEAMDGALQRVLLAPAPHLAALGAKLELLFAHAIEPDSAEADVLAAIREDVERLLSRQA